MIKEKFKNVEKNKKRDYLLSLLKAGKELAEKSKNPKINEMIKKRANY